MELIDLEEKNKTDRRSRARLARKQFPSATARLGLIKQTTLAIIIKKIRAEQLVLVIENNQSNNSLIITIDSSLQSLRLKIVKI